MKVAEACDDGHPNSEDANISAHAEMSWYEPLACGCRRSFVDRDWDVAAAVALGEAQDGLGQKLVDAAGEITDEAQRAQRTKDILSEPETHTYSNQLLHLARLGLSGNCLPTQEALVQRYLAAKEEKNEKLRRSYDFLKNAITNYVEALARIAPPQPSMYTDLRTPEEINVKSGKLEKGTLELKDSTRSVKKAPRKRKHRQSASHAVTKTERFASKRTRRLARLGLSDHGSDLTPEVLEKAYVQQMQKLKRSQFPSNHKKQRVLERMSRAFRYLMKVRVEGKTRR